MAPAVEELALKGREEALAEGVVVGVAYAAHRTARDTRFVNADILTMDSRFFERPVLDSPYAYPARHWELDAPGQPTGDIIEARRTASSSRPSPSRRNTREARGRSAWCPPPCGPVARHQQPERVGGSAQARQGCGGDDGRPG